MQISVHNHRLSRYYASDYFLDLSYTYSTTLYISNSPTRFHSCVTGFLFIWNCVPCFVLMWQCVVCLFVFVSCVFVDDTPIGVCFVLTLP